MKSNRRSFFQTLSAGSIGLTVGAAGIPLTSFTAPPKNSKQEDGPILQIGENIAIAETSYGKVKGFILRGIYTFLGIPYGADTSGKNRFMPPQKPTPWNDIRPAVWWGNSAPQIMDYRYANAYSSFVDHWNYDDVSEDCLRINIWTPAIGDGKKRPVMVWLHGGGYTNGNGIEQDGYSGENITRRGDIVFCSVNHRLGPIGFTNLAGVGGEKYAKSGNVGMLDIVAALEWIKDNIVNFGGDPGNITIMGQSGGGAKVCTVLAMPSAKGLVHKGVALSGSTIKAIDKSYSEKLGSYILNEAGLSPAEVDKLQDIPWKDYILLANSAGEKLARDMGGTGMMRGNFGPVADGVVLPLEPYFSDLNGHAAQVPLILSTTFNEMSPSRTDASLENITLEEVKAKVKDRAGFSAGMGDKAGAVVDAYAKAFPDKKPVEIWSMIMSNRVSVVATANAKVKQHAPVYVAWFGWQPPLFDKRMRAFHCLDICFWYYNTDLMYTHTGGGARPRKLSAMMADSLLKFMRTGNPNGGGLPAWDSYTSEKGETMILDDLCALKNDPDREARSAIPVRV